ncbi:MAG: sigma-70 family RNA polymerase sigma factor [Capsulimonadaceae bacterium]
MAFAQVICLTHGDRVLIDRCLRNDTAAFDEVVGRYKNKVYSYILRMVGSTSDAEDLTQEVFIRMYTSLGSFRSQASLNTWLFRIAGNLCIDHYRRGKKNQNIAYSLDDPIDQDESSQVREVPDTTYDPQRVFEQGEMSAQIEKSLTKLPEKLRSVVILHDIEGLQYDEIAQVVGCPLGTVKSRLFNARVQLRDLLSAYVRG